MAAVCLLLAALAGGCAGRAGSAARRDLAAAIAASGGLTPVVLETGPACPAPLVAFGRNGRGGTLAVYIEGDGQAYRNRSRPSDDPTPVDPVGLRLAARAPDGKAVYLARPGQGLSPEILADLDSALWTTQRYAPQTIACLNTALDVAKAFYGADSLRLIGYSGGGSLAVLLAAGRTDVVGLVTVAANLDLAAWAELHGLALTSDWRNPADVAPAVAHIPQTHVVGSDDANTPPWLCRRFLSRLGDASRGRCLVLDGADHHRGLAEAWSGVAADGPGPPSP
ncbi:MAG TPA: alpha/beta hydrolase [Solidesulfovibrio magneticus]|nr:alpha/beta hydrolase [Solidesulfovibrio magneticus]